MLLRIDYVSSTQPQATLSGVSQFTPQRQLDVRQFSLQDYKTEDARNESNAECEGWAGCAPKNRKEKRTEKTEGGEEREEGGRNKAKHHKPKDVLIFS